MLVSLARQYGAQAVNVLLMIAGLLLGAAAAIALWSIL